MKNLSDQEKLVFMHIPKTGGTTLHNILLNHFVPEKICPERFNRIDKIEKKDLLKYKFFSGHFDRRNVDLIPGPKKTVTILREPKSRILSLYRFWKSHRWETIEKYNLNCPRLAKSLGLLEFLRHSKDGIPQNIDNIQSRTIIGGLSVGPNREYRCPKEEVLETASKFLDSLFCVGIMEEYADTIDLFCDSLGVNHPKDIPITRNHKDFHLDPKMEVVEIEAVTAEVQKELDTLTEMDSKLYEYAKTLFKKRLSVLNQT